MTKGKNTKRVCVSVYFEKELIEAIKELAKEDCRSVSNLIEKLVVEYVSENKR